MVVERGPRPIVVTAAGMLLFAQAVITLLSFLLLLANQDEVISAAVRQADESDSSGQNVESFVKFSVYAVGGCSLLMAAVVAVFAMLVLRGKNWARITTAILAGLFAVLGLFGVISSAVQPMEGVAGWYTACSLILTTASTLCLGASAVMLLLPATNDWFSKR
jgi:hypothetical protein